MNNRARAWCFTLNNYTQDAYDNIGDALRDATTRPNVSYAIVAREVGDSGTPHLQGYVYFSDACNMASVKRVLRTESVHLERAKGSAQDNYTYCSKDADFYEVGTKPHQGKRSDLDEIRAQLEEGATVRSILKTARSFQGCKFAQLYRVYHPVVRTSVPEIHWYWGETETGKTKAAVELCPGAFWVNSENAKWWCGYDEHEFVIWDDFRPDQVKFTRLLRLTDRYPVACETKGGQVQLVFTKIVFTGPKHPKEVYDKGEEEVKQLMRRITKVTHFIKI